MGQFKLYRSSEIDYVCKDDAVRIGQEIKAMRIAAGLSQEELGKLAHHSAISRE